MRGDGSSVRKRFGKCERLRHRSLVTALFSGGESVYAYPLRMIWRVTDDAVMGFRHRHALEGGVCRLQMMVTVPKKRLRRAVDRVRVRRRIREAYRLNRVELRDAVEAAGGRYVQLALIFVGEGIPDYGVLERKVVRLLEHLRGRIFPGEDAPSNLPHKGGGRRTAGGDKCIPGGAVATSGDPTVREAVGCKPTGTEGGSMSMYSSAT